MNSFRALAARPDAWQLSLGVLNYRCTPGRQQQSRRSGRQWCLLRAAANPGRGAFAEAVAAEV